MGLLSSYSLNLVTRTLLPRTVKEIELGKGYHLPPFCLFDVEQFKFHTSFASVLTVEMMTSSWSGGCEAGLVLVDGWHQLRVEQVAARLQERVREAAMEHYRSDIQHLRGHQNKTVRQSSSTCLAYTMHINWSDFCVLTLKRIFYHSVTVGKSFFLLTHCRSDSCVDMLSCQVSEGGWGGQRGQREEEADLG